MGGAVVICLAVIRINAVFYALAVFPPVLV